MFAGDSTKDSDSHGIHIGAVRTPFCLDVFGACIPFRNPQLRAVRARGQGGVGGSDAGTGGTNGANGNSVSGFGLDGADNDALGGGKGAGIRDNGATVNLFGATPTRYINGSGDH